MNSTATRSGRSKAKTVVCTIGMIFAILAILAIASALAVRLLEIDSGEKASSFLHNILNPGDHADDAAERTRLWVLALVDLGLAVASGILALAAGRTRSVTTGVAFVIVAGATCAVAFFLAWPLAALTGVIPLTAVIALPMAREEGG